MNLQTKARCIFFVEVGIRFFNYIFPIFVHKLYLSYKTNLIWKGENEKAFLIRFFGCKEIAQLGPLFYQVVTSCDVTLNDEKYRKYPK